MTAPKDEKYIVFKRAEWDHFMGQLADYAQPGHGLKDPDELPDAVVIRRQDVFAAPALNAYACAIQAGLAVAASAGVSVAADYRMARLSEIADYFHQQAEASAMTNTKVPD